MAKAAVFVAALLALLGTRGCGAAAAGGDATAAAGAGALTLGRHERERPWFCHGLDCPRYKVLEATDDYEVRRYDAGVWVSTEVEQYAYAVAAPVGFRRLFDYISGGNADAEKIAMTAPVRTRIDSSAGPFCKNNFTVSFFVPPALAHDPPAPSSGAVFISREPGFTAYVSASGGFKIEDYSIARMLKRLTRALDADGRAYAGDHFFFAGYDPPFRLAGRHSEVWVLADEGEGGGAGAGARAAAAA